MEWSEETHRFEKRPPMPPPLITVDVHLMNDVHKEFGIHCDERSGKRIDAIADTGCQTSTCGIDTLKTLKIPERYLIPTSHGIVGITDTRLQILGTLMLKITYMGKETKQMVYVSGNAVGLYLSEKALSDLGLIDRRFPNIENTTHLHAAVINATKNNDNQDDCKCIPREPAPDPPKQIPYPPTEENKKKLKEWLTTTFASSAFNTCTHQPLPEITGEPMKFHFKDTYEPHAVHTPIPIAYHIEDAVDADIDRDVRLGLLEKVPEGTPVEWCARMVVQIKKDGTPRRTIDFQELNKATKRETHFTPTPFSIVSTTPANTYKTVLDAWNGYHSLPLSEEAKAATTFITKRGRYRYLRAPQGFHASGDAYTHRFDNITKNIERVKRCVDDSLLWDVNISNSFWHTYEYLKHCSDNGIIFNLPKFQFAEPTCEFAGFEVTPTGYRPPKRILDAIRDFPTPISVTDMKSWFGLINQVSHYFAQAKAMAPFRELLSKNTKLFYWDEVLDKLFHESKSKIIEQIKDGVRTFEKNRVTCLATDWSKTGLGFTLSQKHCSCTGAVTPICGDGHWHLILAGSRFTKPPESRYAPIEGEALAVVWGLQQCKIFIIGCPKLIVAVDHKPLTKILNDRPLESIENPRLLRLKEKTLMYDYEIVHIQGKNNCGPDATSRYPTKSAAIHEDEDDICKELTRCAVAFANPSQIQ